MNDINTLLSNNEHWADELRETQPEFFSESAKSQSPQYLWIGCSDSRVPETQIMELLPGDMFVHRNIANQVIKTDLSCLSVLQYAVEVLKVKHVIVCGHYGCGGVQAAMGDQPLGLIDNWIADIKGLVGEHQELLEGLPEEERFPRMCEINAMQQAENVVNTSVLKAAIARGQEISIHTWIYDLEKGRLHVLGEESY